MVKSHMKKGLILMGVMVSIPIWSWASELKEKQSSLEGIDESQESVAIQPLTTSFLGSGTENDPFLIQSPEDLNQLRIEVNGGNSFEDQFFLITDDLDFEGFDDDGDASNGNFTPIGTADTPFKGSLDGGGHTISNLKMSQPNQNLALFAYKTGGIIEKLELRNFNIGHNQGEHSFAPLIVEATATKISEVSVIDGVIGDLTYGWRSTGGLVVNGQNIEVENVYIKTLLKGGYVGGVAYSLNDSTVKSSYIASVLKAHTNNTVSYKGSVYRNGNRNQIEHVYHDETLMGLKTDVQSKNLSSDVFHQKTVFGALDGFDFTTIWKTSDENLNWDSYPVFQWQSHREAKEDKGYDGGIGTKENPYLISTPEHLNHLRQQVELGESYEGAHFLITHDLDFKGFDDDGNESNGNFTPIGSEQFPFRGSLDGGEHMISNLRMFHQNRSLALFAYKVGGVVRKLELRDFKFENKQYSQFFAGLINEAIGVKIDEVAIIDGFLGGLTYGDQRTSGLISNGQHIEIENVYVKSTLMGNTIGGIADDLISSTVKSSYVASVLKAPVGYKNSVYRSGNSNQIEDIYHDETLTGLKTDVQSKNLSSDVFHKKTVLGTVDGFDFTTVWKTSDENLDWDSYPIFQWQTHKSAKEDKGYDGGIGTKENPYLIAEPKHLNYLRQQVELGESYEGAHFLITHDLDFKGFDDDGDETNGNFTPIGTEETPFKGSLDGNRKQIINLKLLHENQSLALFRYKTGGVVKNLKLRDVEVHKKVSNVGMSTLILYAQSVRVEEVGVSEAKVGEITYWGTRSSGLIYEANDSFIQNCYVEGDLIGESVGGLIYTLRNSTVENGYVATTIESNNSNSKAPIYYEGDVNVILNYVYYDSSVLSTTKIQGIPLTTEEFVEKTSNEKLEGFGFNTVWRSRNGYPQFVWEPAEVDISVNGTIEPTMMNISVPTAPLEFVLNPNEEVSFISPDLVLTSETIAPIQISLGAFEQMGDVMLDVSPDQYSDEGWSLLGLSESKSWALGLESSEMSAPIYVSEVTDILPLGVIKKNQEMMLSFTAKHGYAFEESLNPRYRLVFLFELLP